MDLPQEIPRAIEVLRRGGVVVFPTDTVYGLGAHIFLPRAVEKVFELKGRSRHQPLPVLVGSLDQLAGLAPSLPPRAVALAERFWPGALTLVLVALETVPELVTAKSGKVAVRVPHHPVPLALIEGLGAPITGTSANLSGQPPARTAEEVKGQMRERVDLVLEGGPPPGGRESTVVDLTGKAPLVLRVGAIPQEEIEECLGAALEVMR
jgi:L-threonylcarbamoyladenylate synthase